MKISCLFCLLTLCTTVLSQENYWQQEVSYSIDVQLDDEQHELHGFLVLDYKNNSPQTLNFIYFHLWANAYKDLNTPFAKQLVENVDLSFRRSKAAQRGYLDSLAFTVNSEVCRWDFETSTDEICKVILNAPLKSGESVRISTPFHVKLPYAFSRLGHVGQSYQISQWYPKPAVYDKDGWHIMPYLDQGEFYAEFGSFDVRITLPENYVVGATGELEDSSEISWLNEKAKATLKAIENQTWDYNYPSSSEKTKTIRFKQQKVHDFAWFADKRYVVLKGEVELPSSKRKVTTWSLFLPQLVEFWKKSPDFLREAVLYYSDKLGDYPYSQVTAVSGALMAGDGMEYPMLTVITAVNEQDLDLVITHEIGHNWLYGILGSNERKYPWMDEGVNSYYEQRYISNKYPEKRWTEIFKQRGRKFFDIHHYKGNYMRDFAYQLAARENRDEPVGQPADKFTSYNYGAMVYGKAGMLFSYLENYLGQETFDRAMKSYFEMWKFKHPQPDDLRQVFEAETGKDLSWFFVDLINTTHKIDYKLRKVKKQPNGDSLQVSIRNLNPVNSPVLLATLKKNSVLHSQWFEGFSGTSTISMPKSEADKIQIDPLWVIPEINRKNNTYKLNRPLHRLEKLRLQFLSSIENQNRTQIFFAPYVGWNNYDKTQVGLAIYSPMVPARKFQYHLVPAFGIGSKQFIGFGKISYHIFPEDLRQITVSLFAQRFSYLLFPRSLNFNKIEPSISVELKKKNSRSPYVHTLSARSVIIISETDESMQHETQRYFVDELKYKMERRSTLHPFSLQATFRHGKNFGNLSAEGRFKISYQRANEGFNVRLFAGGFLFYNKSNTDISAPNPRFYLSNATNNATAYWLQKDYMYDETFMDRNGRDRNLARQVSVMDGGFRSNTNVGATRKFISAVNLSSTIYRFVPFRPMASGALWVDENNKLNLAAEAGFSLVLLPEMAEVHLPFLVTNNIRNNQKVIGINKWYQRITFTLKWNLQNPLGFLRQYLNL